MIIKLLLLAGILGAVITALRSSTSMTYLALRRVALLAFGVAAAVSVLSPGTLTWVANRVGVGRGTDLVLYGMVVVFLFVTISVYQRMRHLEEQIVRVTRALALRDRDLPNLDGSEQ
jgi:small membrane protein